LELAERLQRGRAELADRTRQRTQWSERIAQGIADAQLSRATDGELQAPGEIALLEQLRQSLDEQQVRVQRRRELRKQCAALQRTTRKLRKSIALLRSRQRKLLHRAGARSVGEVRRMALESARVELLEREAETLDREIAAGIQGQSTLDAVRAELEATLDASLADRLNSAQARLDDGERLLAERCEALGRLNHELRMMAEDRGLGRKQLEISVCDARLHRTLRAWQAQSVAHSVLDEIRKQYESDRQPETLRDASRYLARLTEGRYTRVWTPLGSQALVVDDARATAIPLERLSRGTREQLYLCLRLALAACFARRGARLPMILDDVLVNYDVARCRAAADLLLEFANEGHQVIVLTCHEHVAQQFDAVRAAVMELPRHDGAMVRDETPPQLARPRRARRRTAREAPFAPAPVHASDELPASDDAEHLPQSGAA
jgi:uncharacterized protein YhaN